MLLSQTCFLVYGSLAFHQSLFLLLAGQRGVLQFVTPFFILQHWLNRCESSWFVPPQSIYPDRCIVSSAEASVGVLHNWQQCWGHVSVGFHVWLGAKVVLREIFFMKMSLGLKQSCDPLVINYGKRKTTYTSVACFLLWNSTFSRRALPHTHTKYRKLKVTEAHGKQLGKGML